MPLGYLGLSGWIAALLPLFLAFAPHNNRVHVLFFGVGVLMLNAFLPDGQVQLVHWFVSTIVFLFGMWLAPPNFEEPKGYRSLAGTSDEQRAQICREALNKELARARRFDRNVTVLSMSAQTTAPGELLGLESVLVTELHAYCHVFEFDERLLAIIPELGVGGQDVLLQRIVEASRRQNLAAPLVGLSIFPADAITTQGLIEIADEKRLSHTVENQNLDASNGSSRSSAFEIDSHSSS